MYIDSYGAEVVYSNTWEWILTAGIGLVISFCGKEGKKRLFAAFLDILIVVKCVEILYTILDFILTLC